MPCRADRDPWAGTTSLPEHNRRCTRLEGEGLGSSLAGANCLPIRGGAERQGPSDDRLALWRRLDAGSCPRRTIGDPTILGATDPDVSPRQLPSSNPAKKRWLLRRAGPLRALRAAEQARVRWTAEGGTPRLINLARSGLYLCPRSRSRRCCEAGSSTASHGNRRRRGDLRACLWARLVRGGTRTSIGGEVNACRVPASPAKSEPSSQRRRGHRSGVRLKSFCAGEGYGQSTSSACPVSPTPPHVYPTLLAHRWQ